MNSELSCSNCDNTVDPDAPWCPHCGALFGDDVCRVHPDEEADGVCVICGLPCCSDCGTWVNDIFLCGTHEEYELIEGRARVYGSMDVLAAEYASRCLEQAGLHPFTYSRLAYRNVDIAPNLSYRQFGGHTGAEVKILVPFGEVTAAETVLRDLAITPH